MTGDARPPRRWRRAALWLAASALATAASLRHVLAGTDLIMSARHDPLVDTPAGAAALFVVLMAPSTVVLGTLVALRRTPLRLGSPAGVAVAVLLLANLAVAAAGVVDGLRGAAA